MPSTFASNYCISGQCDVHIWCSGSTSIRHMVSWLFVIFFDRLWLFYCCCLKSFGRTNRSKSIEIASGIGIGSLLNCTEHADSRLFQGGMCESLPVSKPTSQTSPAVEAHNDGSIWLSSIKYTIHDDIYRSWLKNQSGSIILALLRLVLRLIATKNGPFLDLVRLARTSIDMVNTV